MTKADRDDSGEPDGEPRPKKRGGKVVKTKGKRPRQRLDKSARGGIHINPAHKGLLHKDTGTPSGKKIPEVKIKKAEHSSNPAVRKRAVFAENAKHWKK